MVCDCFLDRCGYFGAISNPRILNFDRIIRSPFDSVVALTVEAIFGEEWMPEGLRRGVPNLPTGGSVSGNIRVRKI